MARISYANPSDPRVSALAAQIAKERGGQLPNLYRMLLNSEPVARGWLTFLTAIRQQCALEPRLRELAILRVAIVNRAQYEYQGHVPYALKAGVRQDQIDTLEDWARSATFDATERAVLAYVDSMTMDIQVPDATFAAVRGLFDDRMLVELTATIGAYNCVSRFLEAVQIDQDV